MQLQSGDGASLAHVADWLFPQPGAGLTVTGPGCPSVVRVIFLLVGIGAPIKETSVEPKSYLRL